MRSDIVAGGIFPDHVLQEFRAPGELSSFHGWDGRSAERVAAEDGPAIS